MIKNTVIFKVTITYDEDEISDTGLKHWIREQLQKMMDTKGGLTGFVVKKI